MRIPPEILARRPVWHFPVLLLAVVVTLFMTALLSGGGTRAIASQTNRISKIQVVVARSDLAVGSTVSREDVMLVVRPIDSLPEGVFIKIEDVVGKIPGAEIPAGVPLAAWLFDSGEVIGDTPAPAEPLRAPRVAEPVAAAEAPKVVPVTEVPPVVHEVPKITEAASRPAPERFEPVVVAEPPPVAEVIQAPVSVEPRIAAVARAPDRKPGGIKAAPPKSARRKFSSYAWVAGGGVTYGVSKSGKIQVVDDTGQVSPLEDYRGDEGEDEQE